MNLQSQEQKTFTEKSIQVTFEYTLDRAEDDLDSDKKLRFE